MRIRTALVFVFALAALGATSQAGAHALDATIASRPLVLISMDGFRWDYCALHPVETPNIRRFMREGISARGLIPVFPSNTFPNHYSIVTGLYPSHHGILNNQMFDPRLGEFFHYDRASSLNDVRWWHGEPIWVTAIKQGRKSACAFWVGSETEIEGVRPSYWIRYDARIAFASRLEKVVEWLTLPMSDRPSIVTVYLEETNSVGHHYGPDSPQLTATIRKLDTEIGAIREALEAVHVRANYVILSDHGMTTTSRDRVLLLDDYVDLSKVQVDFDESCAGLRPLRGETVDGIMQSLSKLPPQAKAYRADRLPGRFHIDPKNPRVPPVWIVPDEGWEIEQRSVVQTARHYFVKGQHGYDPALQSMHGILIAAGPSFESTGATIDEVENIHVYNLLCAILHLAPAPNDGDDRLVRAMLR